MLISYLVCVTFFIIFLHLPLALSLPFSTIQLNSLNNDLSFRQPFYSANPSDTSPPTPPTKQFSKHPTHLKKPTVPKPDNILTISLASPDRDADLYHSMALFSSHKGWRSRNPFSGGMNFMAGFNNLFGGGCAPADTILRIQGMPYTRSARSCTGGEKYLGAVSGGGGGFAEGAGGTLGQVSWDDSDGVCKSVETAILRTGILGAQSSSPINRAVGKTSACIRLGREGAESIMLLRHLSTVPRTQAALWEDDNCEGEPDQWAGMLVGTYAGCTQARKSGGKRTQWRSLRVWYGSERLGAESWGAGSITMPGQGTRNNMEIKTVWLKGKRELIDLPLTDGTTIKVWYPNAEEVFDSRFWRMIVGLARELSFHTTKTAGAVKTGMQSSDVMGVPAIELSGTDDKWVKMKVREWRTEHNRLEPETKGEMESLARKLEV